MGMIENQKSKNGLKVSFLEKEQGNQFYFVQSILIFVQSIKISVIRTMFLYVRLCFLHSCPAFLYKAYSCTVAYTESILGNSCCKLGSFIFTVDHIKCKVGDIKCSIGN